MNMQHGIHHISNEEFDLIYRGFSDDMSVWVGEIDGRIVDSWKDYARQVSRAFRFPTPCENSIDAYLDWIRDLDWLEKDGYILVIRDFGMLLRNDPKLKKEIIDDFLDVVLPWWEGDVEKYSVGGKAKCFSVYLIG
jgi:hypothetical protein